MKKWIIPLAAGLLAWLSWEMYWASNWQHTEGLYRTAFARNENNTGPVVRAYAICAKDTLWEAFKTYGEAMPYTKYGTTTVFFFLEEATEGCTAPLEIAWQAPFFGEAYQPKCIAKFEKGPGGIGQLYRYPFAAENQAMGSATIMKDAD